MKVYLVIGKENYSPVKDVISVYSDEVEANHACFQLQEFVNCEYDGVEREIPDGVDRNDLLWSKYEVVEKELV